MREEQGSFLHTMKSGNLMATDLFIAEINRDLIVQERFGTYSTTFGYRFIWPFSTTWISASILEHEVMVSLQNSNLSKLLLEKITREFEDMVRFS